MKRGRKTAAKAAQRSVAAVGLEMATLIKADPENDPDWKPQRGKPKLNEKESRRIFDRIQALKLLTTHEIARTPADAFVQVMQTYSALMDLRDNFLGAAYEKPASLAETYARESDRREISELVRAAERCLFSLLHYFEEQHGLDGDAFAADYFMGSWLDPFGVSKVAS